MSEWKEYILEEVIEKFIDYRGKTPKKTTFGVPLVTAKIVKNGRLLEPNEFIAEEDYESWMTRGYPEINDVILTSEAPLGEVALIKNKNIALAQRIITLQTKKNLCDSIFLKYYLQSSIGQASLQSRASGSTVEGIKAAELRKLDISLPSIPDQIAIAEILSSLDDKIDLLHRQNQTLEQMAETLFRQWFIEEAKEEWKLFKIKDIAIHKKDSVNPSKNPFGEYKHFSLPAFDSGKKPQVELGNTIHSNKYRVHKNSILVSKLNPRIPRIWLNLKHVDEMCICSTEFQVIHPNRIDYLGFLFCLLKSDDAVAELEMSASGTSGSHQRVRPEDILNLKFSTPSLERVQEFSQIIEPLLSKNDQNLRSIINLEKQRDTLLPKLMSGEVRVKIDKE
jgi:type I restriction enzyme S subunit